MSTDPYDIACRLGAAFERLGIDYFLGGSMASSLQGPPRYTQDIDFVVNLRVDHVPKLLVELGSEFDVDDVALLEAIRARQSWNIFHTPTATRIDLFPVGPSEYDVEELFRRRRVQLPRGRSIQIKSPEDSILRKLCWYRAGGEANQQQFRDAVGILRYLAGRLDARYLDVWAEKLGITDLLVRAREALTSAP